MISRNLKSLLVFLTISSSVAAQETDSLLNQMTDKSSNESVNATFKSTRIVLSQSTETQKKYDLNLLIGHRFGDIGGDFGGSHTLYGLDVATDLYIGFDYGVTDRFTLGIGRSKQDETYNLFLKHKVLQQSKTVPISATAFAQGAWVTREDKNNEFKNTGERSSFIFQALIARKFSNILSLQLSPGYLVRSVVTDPVDEKGMFVAGIAGRLKLNKRFSLIADYQWSTISRSDKLTNTYYNPLGLGLEIETGGHVFALNFMNSPFILENNFLPNTLKSWTDGGVRFGFTMSRNFSLHKSKNPDINSKIY
ncbi:DUF5777 family beta-barrel protein [Desertivirga arenae]|uniref:DUF5777 family beta-barrel protein n=1 Tax=Desertivirga arenae TaxID=2810309 RepID=UPI001A973CA0|nr:DUF5777 family beta-barrel protein [Pedobacter sp. SYSU D00823]